MATSNLDRLIISFPHSDFDRFELSDIRDHQFNSSSSSSTSSSSSSSSLNLDSGSLKIQFSSSAGEFKVGNGEDNPKTPRSVEHRNPVTATCPPAPRKPKWSPTTGKRKERYFPAVRVPADFMVYMDAMLALNETVYVPDIVVGDLGSGDLVKRLKLLTPPAHED